MARRQRDAARGGQADAVASASRTTANVVPRLSLPAYLAAVLTRAEEELIERDVALHDGDDDAAQDREKQVTGLICVALNRVLEEYHIPPDMEITPSISTFLRGDRCTNVGLGDVTLEQFRSQEVQLLHLVGLSVGVAAKHVDAALATVRLPGGTVTSTGELTSALEGAAAAACAAHEALRQARQAQVKRRRWRKSTYRCLLAGGGVLIVVANTAATTFLGPLAPVSLALGGGAAGAAANLIED